MRIILFLILFLSSSISFSQQADEVKKISVTSSISFDTIAIGDQVNYNITAIVPANYKIKFPILSDTLAKGVEVIRRSTLDSSILKDNTKKVALNTLISSYDSGLHRIPSLPLIINNDTVFTDSLLLAVFTLPKDTAIKEIYDIKAPISEPLTFSEVAPWVGGGLILAAIIFLLFMYLKSRKQNRPFKLIQKPAEPPHVIALRELEKIKEDKLWLSDNHKYYYTRLIDVLRQYIEARYLINAMEQTTVEIIRDLKGVDFQSAELLERLNETLTLSDLVKFAKFIPLVSENERCLSFAFDFVENTKQEVIVQETSNDNQNKPEPVKI